MYLKATADVNISIFWEKNVDMRLRVTSRNGPLINKASIRGYCVWRQEHAHLSVNGDGTPVSVIIRSRKLSTHTHTLSCNVQIIIFCLKSRADVLQ